MCCESVESGHRVGLHPELLGLRQPDPGAQQASRQHGQPDDRDATDERRPVGHRLGDAVPRARLDGVRGPRPRNERPEQLFAEQGQQRRQHQQHEHGGDHQSAGRQRTQAARAGNDREKQGQQGQHHGGVARGDRRSRGANRGPQCLAVIVGVPQLFSVSRDHQQGVVGAGTEHQHAGDAGGRTVERQARRAGHQGAHRGGHPVGETHHRERHQPQHGRAVGDDQQECDHQRRDDQQGDVSAGERVRDVGAERGAAGDVGGQRVREFVGCGAAQVLDRVVESEARKLGVQRHRRDSGLPVL